MSLPYPLLMAEGEATGSAAASTGATGTALTETGATGTPAGYTALDWRSGLPADLQAEPSLRDYREVSDVAKALVETKKMVGGMVRVPKADAPEEEWQTYFERSGRPGKAEEYAVPSPVGTEGAAYWTPEVETLIRGIAHKAGLNQRQAQTLVPEVARMLGEGHNRMEASQAEAGERLQAELAVEWGAAKPQKLRLAQAALRRFTDGTDGPDLWQYLEDTGLGNNKSLVKMFARIGELLPEDSLIESSYGPLPTLTEIDQQIAEANKAVTDALQKGGEPLKLAQGKLKAYHQQKAALQERAQAQAQRRH